MAEEERAAEEKLWGMLAHLLTFLVVVVPLGNLLAPIAVRMLKKELVFVRRHAWAALNFQLTLMLHALVVACGLMLLLAGGESAWLGLVLLLGYAAVVWVASVVLVVLGGVRAYEGKRFRYPFTVRFLDEETGGGSG